LAQAKASNEIDGKFELCPQMPQFQQLKVLVTPGWVRVMGLDTFFFNLLPAINMKRVRRKVTSEWQCWEK